MYSFGEKNRITQQLSGAEHFDRDRELYTKVFPSGKLEKSLARSNQFTRGTLDSKMVFELLSRVSKEEILSHRRVKTLQEEEPLPEPVVNEQPNLLNRTMSEVLSALGLPAKKKQQSKKSSQK